MFALSCAIVTYPLVVHYCSTDNFLIHVFFAVDEIALENCEHLC